MYEFTIEHKHCHTIRRVTGKDFFTACWANGYNTTYWKPIHKVEIIH